MANTTQAGALIQELVWLNDIPVATIRTDQSGGSVGVFYIHTDHLNAPAKITRPSDNQIIWRWDHDPYGNGTPNQDPDGNGLQLAFNLRFPGQYYDAETGLLYNWNRYYDQSTGRYISSDPIGLAGGINTYAYASGNPITHFDPTGLDCISANGQMICGTPDGPAFIVPAPPGFPAHLGPNNFFYHQYDVQRDIGCANPDDVTQGLINNPTPGNANPATSNGTPNNAVVPFLPLDNFVTSYLTMDTNTGAELVVNVTGAGSAFGPGYVARYVADGTAHTFGEGLNPIQSPFVLSPLIQYAADEALWGRQMSKIIDRAKSKCGCGH